MKRHLIHTTAILTVLALTAAATAGNPTFKGVKIGGPKGGIKIGNFPNPGGFKVTKPVVIGQQQHQHGMNGFPKILPHNNSFNGQKLFKLTPTYIQKNYHTQFGVKKPFGYCYQGYQHQHWSYKCWAPTYGCYVYWDPCLRSYYYWCVPDNCWYPVTYCPYGKFAW
ncbi:MAG: hypothetical protein AB7K24_17405 [Gemmataceae bacterium]